jgi:hypothetical protein
MDVQQNIVHFKFVKSTLIIFYVFSLIAVIFGIIEFSLELKEVRSKKTDERWTPQNINSMSILSLIVL